MRKAVLRSGLWVLVPALLAGAAIGIAPAQGQPVAAAPTPLPPGAGTDRVKTHCTACHGLDFITRQPRGRGAAWWAKTVDNMVDTHGAELPDEDRKAITLFLTRVNG